MRNIKSTVQDLLVFFRGNRGNGSSTLIRKMASENNVYVLVETKEIGESCFKGSYITFEDLNRLDGMVKRPILVDNSVMLSLLDYVNDKFTSDDISIRNRDVLIGNIKGLLRQFETLQ